MGRRREGGREELEGKKSRKGIKFGGGGGVCAVCVVCVCGVWLVEVGGIWRWLAVVGGGSCSVWWV